MSEFHIAARDLTKQFRQHRALDRCTLEVRRGEVFGLLGPNGAGKTTLLRLLLGYLRPTSGTATIGGLDCHLDRVAVHRQCGYLPAEARLFRSMNGRQVLRFLASIHPAGDYGRAVSLAGRLDLELGRWVAFMSTGMRQKLALAAVLSLDVPLTILDEPTANLDPSVRQVVLDLIREKQNSGGTVVFSSHVLSEVEEVCDRVAILRAGRVVHEQPMQALRGQYRIEAICRPDELAELGDIASEWSHDGETGRVRMTVSGDLRPVLGWLARNAAAEVEVHRAGLRDVYRTWHGAREGEA